MAEAIPIVRRLLFPAPQPPQYDYDSYPDSMIWIPSPPPYKDIPAIFIPYREADALLVFAHGNGTDIGGMYKTLQYYKNHWKVNILLFEYPGYGHCAGVPSEESINNNMKHVYLFIRDVLNWPTDRLILFGQSIGTGPVCQLAYELNQQKTPLGGIILQSPYTRLKDVVQFLAGKIASHLIKTSFNNLECVQHITDPIFIIHGIKDEIIPISQSNLLYEKCVSQRKHLLVVNHATHNEFDHHHDIIAPIQQFLQCYLRTPARQPDPAAIAAAEKAAALAHAAELEAAAERNASSSSSFNSLSSSTTTKPPPTLPAYFIHQPPSSPMPPSTLKIEHKYFSVPTHVIETHRQRLEAARSAAESRAKHVERKEAVKGFFYGLGNKIANVSSAIIGSVSSSSSATGRNNQTTTQPTQHQHPYPQPQPQLSRPPASSPHPHLYPKHHPNRHLVNTTSTTDSVALPSSSSTTSTQPAPVPVPGSPQRAHSPAATRHPTINSSPSGTPIEEYHSSPAAVAPISSSNKEDEETFTISDTIRSESQPDEEDESSQS